MRKFKTKEETFLYIKNKFVSKDVVGIAVVGSTAKGKIKKFSDIDIVVFNTKKLKPYYELCLIKDKLVLITAYFYRPGEIIGIPENGRIIYGNYYSQIEHKGNLNYNQKERIKRDNQMFLDGFFKFLRSGDKKHINWIEKYNRF